LNSYKPFACGIVIHPTIEGCMELREEIGPKVDRIASVELRTHPLVLELTGKTEPKTGLEGKFSVYHAAAAALLRADGSPTAFTDEAVNDSALIALRRAVRAETDPACAEDAVTIRVTLDDGRSFEKRIEHAIGSHDRPLTDAQLETKFLHQAALVIGQDASRRLMATAWRLAELSDAGEVARASVPQQPARAAATAR
ncbi:MAG TPA: MmgE/PrpD family protein, partial [Propylenella sp.]|nr:MmgE/PrpD family protein [Propylenella sp.]